MKNNITLIFALLIFTALKVATAQGPFTGKPIYEILTKRLGDTLGITNVELFPNIAPFHVRNFDSLVNVNFYDSTAFHRVIPGFMIQGGDPNSRSGPISTWGLGQASQPTVNAEFSAAKHLRGILSAARDNNINSATSQFFICVVTAAWLNGQYSVYGRVVSGMNYVDTIVSAPRDANDNPLNKIEMFVSYLGSNDTVPNAPALKSPLNGSYGSSTSRSLQWFAVSDAIIYHLELATDSLFTNLFKSVDVGTNVYTVTGLTTGTTYYWRVKTNNGGHFSSYTNFWNFKVSGVGIETYAAGNKIIVAPNPSNGQFLFSNLENESRIDIYDVLGKVVFSTITKNTSYLIDLLEKEKGIYFYSVSHSSKKTQQGKIIIK